METCENRLSKDDRKKKLDEGSIQQQFLHMRNVKLQHTKGERELTDETYLMTRS